MFLKELTDALLFLVSQWFGVTLPRIAGMALGLVLCTAAVTALWTRRVRVAPALLGLFAGAFVTLISFDTRTLHWLVTTSYMVRTRWVMGLLSVLVLGVTFEAVRRSRLKERYAILWVFTGIIILLCAFFPGILEFLKALLGMQYVTAVGVVMFVFFLLVLFHMSLALSNLQEDEVCTAQRCAQLEARLEQVSAELAALRGDAVALPVAVLTVPEGPAEVVADSRSCGSMLRGFVVGVPVVIVAAVMAVLWSGLQAPQAMLGDEVTHYFMLTHQADVFPSATFQAHIPTGWGEVEIRNYPHVNLWHYVGAWLYRSLPYFETVQAYQALFLAQLLVAAFFLIRRREASTPAILLYLLVLASLPMTLLFSVAFYQDVPVTAQAVTAFALLDRRRWLWATLFMMVALAIKVTAFLFLPAFLVLLLMQRLRLSRQAPSTLKRLLQVALPVVVAGVLLWVPMRWSDTLLRKAGGRYHPFEQIENRVKPIVQRMVRPAPKTSVGAVGAEGAEIAPVPVRPRKARAVPERTLPVIANHPGDLRQGVNWVLYGGVLLWLVVGLGLARFLCEWPRAAAARRPKLLVGSWPFWVGLSFLVPTAVLLKSAPDARFFLPGLPFLLLPLVEAFARLPRQRIMMSLLVAVAILQGGSTLSKAIQLRKISPELRAGMAFLEQHPPEHGRVFMYPEGNYRLFPVRHDWYLGYRLREFWRADNDRRLRMLGWYELGAIVVKKHLVAPVDDAILNLGVYPDYFVKQIGSDARFRKVFDNPAMAIYTFSTNSLPPVK